MSSVPKISVPPDKVETIHFEAGGSQTSGTFKPGSIFKRFSSSTGINVSEKTEHNTFFDGTRAVITTPITVSRIDNSSSSSSSQSSSSSEENVFPTTIYRSIPASTDSSTEKSDRVVQTKLKPGYSSTYLLIPSMPTKISLPSRPMDKPTSSSSDLISSSTSSLTTSSSVEPPYLFGFDVYDDGGGVFLPGTTSCHVEYRIPGEIAFRHNGLLYKLKPTTFGRYYAYSGVEKNQLTMMGPTGTVVFLKPV